MLVRDCALRAEHGRARLAAIYHHVPDVKGQEAVQPGLEVYAAALGVVKAAV
jgi:hypothetical protein